MPISSAAHHVAVSIAGVSVDPWRASSDESSGANSPVGSTNWSRNSKISIRPKLGVALAACVPIGVWDAKPLVESYSIRRPEMALLMTSC
jgi:hypothetical protein